MMHLDFICLIITLLLTLALSKLTEESRPLEFVHIPKTAGTAIEHAAAKAKIPWGACHCLRSAFCEGVADMPLKGFSWHLIPTNKNARFMYEGKNTFTVVRDPYERAISAYYYQAKRKPNHAHNRESLNNFILHELKRYWLYKPQSLYAYGEDGRKIIDHVLHFETLGADFENLMKSYNLNVTLPNYSVNARRATKLGVKSLHKHAVNLINEYYDRDFSNFGYKKFTKGKRKSFKDITLG